MTRDLSAATWPRFCRSTSCSTLFPPEAAQHCFPVASFNSSPSFSSFGRFTQPAMDSLRVRETVKVSSSFLLLAQQWRTTGGRLPNTRQRAGNRPCLELTFDKSLRIYWWSLIYLSSQFYGQPAQLLEFSINVFSQPHVFLYVNSTNYK